jgi:thymidylate synthase
MDSNKVWTELLQAIMHRGELCSPRGKLISEVINASYTVDMQSPVITKRARKMAYGFMFGEAAWIVSGSNWLSGIQCHMKRYADFSDDGVFLNGAYGPKVAEQYTYAVNTLIQDPESRQAVIGIWRERPAPSKDIPCTLSMQFFIRSKTLHAVVNMRSQDAVWGFSYDIFTFSQVANMVRVLLLNQGVAVRLGLLHVQVGSAHIYEHHFADLPTWINCSEHDLAASHRARDLASFVGTPHQLISRLEEYADEFRN